MPHAPGNRHVIVLSAVFALAAGSLPAVAQKVPRVALLAVPEKDGLRCRVLRHEPHERWSSATSLRWEFLVPSTEWQERVIHVAFDSTGTPLDLIEKATELVEAGQYIVHGIVVRFAPDGQFIGIHSRSDRVPPQTRGDSSAIGADASAPPVWMISVAEAEQARTLAQWLWQHRCSGPARGSM